ncbi:hypothetical protein ACFWPQ_20375 [Streptomyces sp. NPDC058464]|uniref:hypothetical protein n=1 Tax=Streptomyces sp. NPDC058464 TaxID=3346511 RepID=UPI00364AFB4B
MAHGHDARGAPQGHPGLLADVAALARDAGTDHDITGHATVLRTESIITGLPWLTPLLETALAFHHAVRGADGDLTDILGRLREATANGEFAYYVPIAAAAIDRPRPDEPDIRRLDDEHVVLAHWRAMVTARRELLRNGPTPT